MPELPDIVVYLEHLERRVLNRTLDRIRLASPFVLRTVKPAIASAEGQEVLGLRRLGKRIVLELEGDLYLVIHLMIAGRLRWRPLGTKPPRKLGLVAFDFPTGTLLLTEAGTQKRASLHLIQGEEGLKDFDRGGLEVLEAPIEAFHARLTEENHTLKRSLTDPRIFSGIGNAYSDEILHRAQLSPVTLTHRLKEDEVKRLHGATVEMLELWTQRLRASAGEEFPEKVTAFHEEMAVHGRYGKPCPVCGNAVQRIVYAKNETNYCAKCQTGGKMLADRALSRLLKSDWPRTLEELEEKGLGTAAIARSTQKKTPGK